MRRVAAVLSLGFACASAEGPDGAEGIVDDVFRIPVTIETAEGPVAIRAEIADSVEERRQGLMFRDSLEPNEGMLFLFPYEQQQSFWMKNTLIPLDMIFIRSDFTILGIVENAEPETLTPRQVRGLSQFVLEILGGRAEELGIEAEQSVRFMAPVPER